jgi:hypothetical protein
MMTDVPGASRSELTPTTQRRLLVLAGPASSLPKEAGAVLGLAREPHVCPSLSLAAPPAIYDLILADYDTLADAARVELEKTSQQLRRKLVIVTSPLTRPQLAQLFALGLLSNVITRSDVGSSDLFVTCHKLLRRDIFGLEPYFSRPTQQQEMRLRTSEDRPDVLKKVEQFALDVCGRERIASRYVSLAEEFLSNALYNAPVDAEGNASYAHLPRNHSVELPAGQEIVVRLITNDERIGISVLDPFGSLTRERLMSELSRCFQLELAEVVRKSGGAGVGLYTVFRSASHFIANLAPGRATEMIGIIDLNGSLRDQGVRGTSFNIFQLQPTHQ